MWQYTDYNELYHHGVKGMKWGVRKDRLKSRLDLAKRKHELHKEARHYTKELNRQDQYKTTSLYRYNMYSKNSKARAKSFDKRLEKRQKKIDKQLSKKRLKKADKMIAKKLKLADKYKRSLMESKMKMNEQVKRYKDSQKQIDTLVKKAVSGGHSIKTKDIMRIVDSQTIHTGAGYPIINPDAPGTHYKVVSPDKDPNTNFKRLR